MVLLQPATGINPAPPLTPNQTKPTRAETMVQSSKTPTGRGRLEEALETAEEAKPHPKRERTGDIREAAPPNGAVSKPASRPPANLG